MPTAPGVDKDKFDRCVAKVKAKGGDYNPYAVCNAALSRKAGERAIPAENEPITLCPSCNAEQPTCLCGQCGMLGPGRACFACGAAVRLICPGCTAPYQPLLQEDILEEG